MKFIVISKAIIRRVYKKEMMNIWVESAKPNTNESPLDKPKRSLKKCKFSKLDILEICGQEHHEECIQRDPTKRIKTQNIENPHPNESSTAASMLIKERKIF